MLDRSIYLSAGGINMATDDSAYSQHLAVYVYNVYEGVYFPELLYSCFEKHAWLSSNRIQHHHFGKTRLSPTTRYSIFTRSLSLAFHHTVLQLVLRFVDAVEYYGTSVTTRPQSHAWGIRCAIGNLNFYSIDLNRGPNTLAE